MWVFGFGSLMWDGWETKYGCTRRLVAGLAGYSRTFNKASVQNWGTKDSPCPTLNLSACDRGVCQGIAFEFPAYISGQLLADLAEREGKGFAFRSRSILLQDGVEVSAFVPFYEGSSLIVGKNVDQIAQLVQKAKGTSGTCFAYIEGIAAKLAELGIEDSVVSKFMAATKSCSTNGN